MTNLSHHVLFYLNLAKAQSALSRRFDAGLGGLGFSEFAILYHLSQAENSSMRRGDLAEKVGLTASGITRLLAPMEKVGLVKREVNKNDARVSCVILAAGGKRRLEEAVERAEMLAENFLPAGHKQNLNDISEFISQLAQKAK